MSGKFITLEGAEGVGKSTNLSFVREILTDCGCDVVLTREPGGTPLAEQLRTLLLAPRDEKVDPVAELLLVFAARAQHIARVILPALERGRWVVSDRFTDATYAYQGYGRGLDVALIEKIEKLVQARLQPDVTIYLDVDVAVGMKRVTQRGKPDRFEDEEIAFFERVRRGYLARAKQYPERFITINAGRDLVSVQADIKAALTRILTANGESE